MRDRRWIGDDPDELEEENDVDDLGSDDSDVYDGPGDDLDEDDDEDFDDEFDDLWDDDFDDDDEYDDE